MWDCRSRSPEALHQVTTPMSDRGCPTTPMHMNRSGSHTYAMIIDAGLRHWVRFHFKTRQGHAHLTNAGSNAKIGQTHGGYQEALFGAIENGDFPKWHLKIQVMPEHDAGKTPYNPFDLTKVWPRGGCPLINMGTLEPNRDPENDFAEVGTCAHSPSNIVPGIAFSPDKVLQARILSCADAHRYRIGTRYAQLPVNHGELPRAPLSQAWRDEFHGSVDRRDGRVP